MSRNGFPDFGPQGPPPNQALSAGKFGFPTPNQPARQTDHIPSGPSPRVIRKAAMAEARRRVENDKAAILTAGVMSLALRDALESLGLSFDQNALFGNPKATPFDVFRRVIVVPMSPDTEQSNSASEFGKAIGNPATNAAVTVSTDPTATVDGDDYGTLVFVSGVGDAVSITIPANNVMILDRIQIKSFNAIAEFEVLFGLGHGDASFGSTNRQFNTARQITPLRRFLGRMSPDGDVALNGKSRVLPIRGPMNSSTVAILSAQHTGETSSSYKPTFHYFEIAMRGWLLSIGPDSLPLNSGVGGADQEVVGP